MDESTKGRVFWGIGETNGRCNRLGDSPEIGEQSFVVSAAFFDLVFPLIQSGVVVLVFFSLFFPIFIVSSGNRGVELMIWNASSAAGIVRRPFIL